MGDRYNEVELEPDILAVLREGDVTVTFITASADALDEDYYKILTWNTNNMTIGISNEFMNEGLEEAIARQIADDIGNQAFDSSVRDRIHSESLNYLGDTLKTILDELLKTSDNPDDMNFDKSLERMLEDN
mgnify:CR=1 FL=1